MAKNKAKAIKDVESRIVDVRDSATTVNCLFYGRNGQGKTRLAATAPKPIIIDVNEHGTQSVRNYPGVKVFSVAKWEDVVYAYWYLREAKHPYETVILDTLTQMQALCMSMVLKKQEDRDPNRPPKMPDQRSWGQMGELMVEQILNYRNLPMNTIFVAQVKPDKSEDENGMESIEYIPNMSPKPRDAATSSVGIIGYIYQGKVKVADKKKKETKDKWVTKMLVGPHAKYITKDRTGLLGRTVIRPTMQQIIEANEAVPEDE